MTRPVQQNVLILGADGFIGHHLCREILQTTQWHVCALDIACDRLAPLLTQENFYFFQGDIRQQTAWVEEQISKADVVVPLVAVASPACYVQNPLHVFELGFETNITIIKLVARHRKRLIFPSTSEVYGMCADEVFHPSHSCLVYGPTSASRWMYASAKQLLDRIIWAYGQRGLDFTIFRPFNWIGVGQDSFALAKRGHARVVTQFMYCLLQGAPLQLVDGGHQRRTFCDIRDGIDALMRILHNDQQCARGTIYNIGNPNNELSIGDLARMMLEMAQADEDYGHYGQQAELQEVEATQYYGVGYQDISRRMPHIADTCADLGWAPQFSMRDCLRTIFDQYRSSLRMT